MGAYPSRLFQRGGHLLHRAWNSILGRQSQYQNLRIIGRGGFGYVKRVQHRLTGAEVAMKVIPKRGGAPRNCIRTEVDIMRKLQHTNIIRLYQVMSSMSHVYLVMEFAGLGDLHNYIRKAGYLQEEEASRIFRQVVVGLQYCHQMGVVHGDLKPENIFLDTKGVAKIGDFGLSSFYTEGQLMYHTWGTVHYFAPERLENKGFDGTKADIWCLGIILYELVVGCKPFHSFGKGTFQENTRKVRYWLPMHISDDLKHLIRQILRRRAKDRPSLEDILNHPWVTKWKDKAPSTKDFRDQTINEKILIQMKGLGFKPKEVCLALEEKTYNRAMGTYLILQDIGQKKTSPSVTPEVSTVTLPPTITVPENQRTSSPAFQTILALPSQHLLPNTIREAGQEGGRSLPMPADSIARGSKNTCCPQVPPLCDATSDHNNVNNIRNNEPETKIQVAVPPKSGKDSPQRSVPPHARESRVQRTKKRVVRLFRRLCICIRVERSSHRSRNRVVPIEGKGASQA